MADYDKSIDEREKDLADERATLESDRKSVQAERERLEGVAKDKGEDKAVGPLKAGTAYIPSTFSNVTTVKIGSTQIGGVSNMKLHRTMKRTKPMSNDIYTGPIASHLVEDGYTISFDSEDMTAIALIGPTAQTITFIWVASQNQLAGGTLTSNQLVTLTNVVFETNEHSASTKDVGKTSVTGTTLGTADNSSPFSMAASS